MYIYVYLYIHIYIHIHTRTHIYTHDINIYIYLYMYVNICVCVYIYIYILCIVCTHLCIYMYTTLLQVTLVGRHFHVKKKIKVDKCRTPHQQRIPSAMSIALNTTHGANHVKRDIYYPSKETQTHQKRPRSMKRDLRKGEV